MTTLVANWKMNGAPSDVGAWIAPLRGFSKDMRKVVCPPLPLLSHPLLARDAEFLANGNGRRANGFFSLGAQDFSEVAVERGAHTGSVSPYLLKETGCSWVILGHSERRRDYGETTEQIAKKAQAAQEAGLGVILCLGETQQEREALMASGGAPAVAKHLSDELGALLAGLESDSLMVAYEPVWAIGSGEAATPEVVGAILEALRERASSMGVEAEFLYGGSVGPDNAADFMTKGGADGLLVGGVSIKPDLLTATLRAMDAVSVKAHALA